jgi:hypothetical protein
MQDGVPEILDGVPEILDGVPEILDGVPEMPDCVSAETRSVYWAGREAASFGRI